MPGLTIDSIYSTVGAMNIALTKHFEELIDQGGKVLKRLLIFSHKSELALHQQTVLADVNGFASVGTTEFDVHDL